MNDINYVNIALVPLIIGVVGVLKNSGLPTRFAPLVSLLLGIMGVFLLPYDLSVGIQVLLGIGTGLSASGLYSGTKATAKVDTF
jgi:hypothetical protein